VMKNFVSPDAPFASALVGTGDTFISEVDESDGSIALYNPAIAVLNNIALDHKTMEELRDLFGGFINRAGKAVLNIDNDEVAALPVTNPITCSMTGRPADLSASDFVERPDGIDFSVNGVAVSLQVPGRHNASNALMALGAAVAAGLPLADAALALSGFQGLKRRLELVGTQGGVTVFDDFGHNPDKIAATLRTLHAFPGRLLIFFQPHGYGPLKLMGEELAATFAEHMTDEDELLLCDPVYFGGTVDKSRGSDWLATRVKELGAKATHVPERTACGTWLATQARPGDRIIIMGARDDSLSVFAEGVLAGV
jgi:UDP-N-acetylmuramate--alanine ligase